MASEVPFSAASGIRGFSSVSPGLTWAPLTLLRNPLRTLAALTDNERGIRICFSNITAGGGQKEGGGGGWGWVGCENDTGT